MIVNDVIDALVAAGTASPDLAGVMVTDGPALSGNSDRDRLFIGSDVDPTAPAAEGQNAPETLPGVVDAHRFAVMCVAESRIGDTDPTSLRQRRSRTFELMTAVGKVLRPSASMRVLGVEALEAAWLGDWQLSQIQTDRGIYVGIAFRVECVARPSTT
jgi:hypothetical protein